MKRSNEITPPAPRTRPAPRTGAAGYAVMATGVAVVSAASATAVIALDSWNRGEVAARSAPAAAASSQSEQRALFLARSALLALQHANVTGSYAVLWKLSAPDFQAANSAERLAEIFAETRRRRLDLSVTALADPVWTAPTEASADGVLRLVGYFPIAGGQLRFDIGYVPHAGQWRVIALAVAFAPEEVAGAVR